MIPSCASNSVNNRADIVLQRLKGMEEPRAVFADITKSVHQRTIGMGVKKILKSKVSKFVIKFK
jgi:hypothetical protein